MLKPSRFHHGFTLIEIMVVITIIGILSGLIVANVVTADPRKELDREARRIKAVLEMAEDEALFGRQDIGVVVTENTYGFARFVIPAESAPDPNASPSPAAAGATSLTNPAPPEPEWVADTQQQEFREYPLSEDYEIYLEVDDEEVDPAGGKKEQDKSKYDLKLTDVEVEEPIVPAIYISLSGEISPFVMEIYLKEDRDVSVKISGDETGRIWIGEDEEI